jgi:hypothetical protein
VLSPQNHKNELDREQFQPLSSKYGRRRRFFGTSIHFHRLHPTVFDKGHGQHRLKLIAPMNHLAYANETDFIVR